MSEAGGIFAFVQLEFGFLLGPADGRYLLRLAPDAPPHRVVVLTTLGAPERRALRGRRPVSVTEGAPEPVPTSRITLIDPEPFPGPAAAGAWLAGVRGQRERADAHVEAAVLAANAALRAHRAAVADPFARDISAEQALVVRLGYGNGNTVADGRYAEAVELPRASRTRPRRSMEAPDERFAALMGAREPLLVCEELVLRARADLLAARGREAALQARVALESLLSELHADLPDERRGQLQADRGPVGDAANAALSGPLGEARQAAVEAAVERMEAALRARRLRSARD